MTAAAAEPTSLERLRGVLADLLDAHGPDVVRQELDALEEAERSRRPETLPAIRAHFRADLASWPEPFRRRLAAVPGTWTEDPARARAALEAFERWRSSGEPEPYSRVLRAVVRLRAAADGRRDGSEAPGRANGELERAKAELLLALWEFADLRVDRARLALACRVRTDYDLAKVERKLASARRRASAERDLGRAQRRAARLEGERDRLRELLGSDLATLRRHATGCEPRGGSTRPGACRAT